LILENNRKIESLLLPTTDLINRQFESLGIHIGDNLMIFELYVANNWESDPTKLRTLVDQYAHDVDHKLNFHKTNLIKDVSDLNLRLLNEVK
jgi:hypothetical protein